MRWGDTQPAAQLNIVVDTLGVIGIDPLQEIMILSRDDLGHFTEILVVAMVAGVGDVKMATFDPPAQARIVRSIHQHDGCVRPIVSQIFKIVTVAKNMALDDPDARRGLLEWRVKSLFGFVTGQQTHAVGKFAFHAGIKISTHMHEFQLAGRVMPIRPVFSIVAAIDIGAVVDVFGDTAPFRARSAGYKNIFQYGPF